MIKQSKKVDKDKAVAAAKLAIDFWATIDGHKLTSVCQKEKFVELVGPLKKPEITRPV